jgi:hypothetical protein
LTVVHFAPARRRYSWFAYMNRGVAMRASCLLLVGLVVSGAVAAEEWDIDFAGHRHVDLADPEPPALPATARDLPIAAQRLSPPPSPCTDELPGRIGYSSDDAAARRQNEASALASTGGRVARKGKQLSVSPARGATLHFVDYEQKGTAEADGDAIVYTFDGTLAKTRLWRVEVHYQHDAPGSWLIDPETGVSLFVHNGGQTTAVSNDGRWLFNAEPYNAPFRVTLTDLADPAFPNRVDCRVTQATAAGTLGACGFDADGGVGLSWAGDAKVAYRLLPGKDGHWSLARSSADGAPTLRCVEP